MNLKYIKSVPFVLAILISSGVFALTPSNFERNQVTQTALAVAAVATAPQGVPTPLAQIAAKDGSFIFTPSASWAKVPLPAGVDGSMQVSALNASKDAYVYISTVNAADIQDLGAWSRVLQAKLAGALTQSSFTAFQNIKVNGVDALSAEVSGVQGGAKFHYLLTTMKTEKYFVYVLAWSFESQFSANRTEFEQLPGSIHF